MHFRQDYFAFSFRMQVLATGLSGLYSSLPTKLEEKGEEWHCLLKDDWLLLPPLVQFMNSLEFCNAVIQVGTAAAESIRGWGPVRAQAVLGISVCKHHSQNSPFINFEKYVWNHEALLESHWISWKEWKCLVGFWKFQLRTNEKILFSL